MDPLPEQRCEIAQAILSAAQASLSRSGPNSVSRHEPEQRVIAVALGQQIHAASHLRVLLDPVDLLGAHLDLRLSSVGDFQLEPDVDSPLASQQHVGPS
jgi:hypothetical protein